MSVGNSTGGGAMGNKRECSPGRVCVPMFKAHAISGIVCPDEDLLLRKVECLHKGSAGLSISDDKSNESPLNLRIKKSMRCA